MPSPRPKGADAVVAELRELRPLWVISVDGPLIIARSPDRAKRVIIDHDARTIAVQRRRGAGWRSIVPAHHDESYKGSGYAPRLAGDAVILFDQSR